MSRLLYILFFIPVLTFGQDKDSILIPTTDVFKTCKCYISKLKPGTVLKSVDDIKNNMYVDKLSDITYIKCVEGHYFLSLVTDLYSKRIMGFNLSDNQKAENAIDALNMAIRNRRFPGRELIHHSDRGFQYCCSDYITVLTKHKIKSSMTQAYDPYENAVAERVNGILKDEFAIGDGFITFSQAQREIKYAIETYNSKRPHFSCNLLTPIHAHKFGNYKLKFWSRFSTNKHIVTKEKRNKKENLITNNTTFN